MTSCKETDLRTLLEGKRGEMIGVVIVLVGWKGKWWEGKGRGGREGGVVC